LSSTGTTLGETLHKSLLSRITVYSQTMSLIGMMWGY